MKFTSTKPKNMNSTETREWQSPQITELEITDQTQQLQPPEEPVQS
jgi:hypothetical protein